jgi:glutathione peroxidase-family protein
MLNPTIDEIRKLVDKYAQDGAILIYFRGDQFGYTSAGKNKKKCTQMQFIANQIFTKIQIGEIKV